MSGVADRITALFRIKANKALDEAKDPRDLLDWKWPAPNRKPTPIAARIGPSGVRTCAPGRDCRSPR
jgi:hypothetical protein